MSDTKELVIVPSADFTMKDLELIEKFKENGMLGLHTLKETDCERCMGLYIDGKTYRQISQLTKIHKSVILFLAHKFKWFELRQEYLDELHATLKDKVMEAKLQSQEFLLHLSMAYRKKIGKNVDQYLRTDNAEFADKIDQKDITTYLKIEDMLHSISTQNPGNSNDRPMVGLNGLGEGVNITKTGPNSMEITPKPSPFSSKLKQFAEMQRQQDREAEGSQKPVRDIDTETLNKKESETKNETK